MTRFFALALVFVSLGASAAQIRGGRYDAATDSVKLDVSYGGGCGEHHFELDYGACMQTYPMQLHAKLVHHTNDGCEAYISRTITLPLDGMSGCRPAHLSIQGDNNSRVSVFVPEN